MRVPWWVGVVTFLVGAGLVGAISAAQRAQEAAADRARLESTAATIASLRAQVGRHDTVYVARRDTFRLLRTRWDTVKSVERTTDTLVRIDTLRLVVRVADSVIAACSAALETCDQRTARLRDWIQVDSMTIRSLQRELTRARLRNRFGCTVGPGATRRGVEYVAASCGLRVF